MDSVPGSVPGCKTLLKDVLGVMSKLRVLSDFWRFLRDEKKYWLMPIVLVFLLFGLLILFAQSSALAPFIYSLF